MSSSWAEGQKGHEFLGSKRLLFAPQKKHVHSSSIVELSDGSFLVAWYEGSGERKANDVKIQGLRLKSNGEARFQIFTLADTPDLPDCNPILWVDSKQRLWLFWVVVSANRWEHSILKYRLCDRPTQGNEIQWSWQDIIVLKPGNSFVETIEKDFSKLNYEESFWAEYMPKYSRMLLEAARDPAKRQRGWMTRSTPLELSDGTFCLPLYSDGFNLSLMALSHDSGKTWSASSPLVSLGGIQPSLIQDSDGVLHTWMRDAGPPPSRLIYSRSHDAGKTWSVGKDTPIANSSASVAALRIKDGRWLMLNNEQESRRNQLHLTVSRDRGKSWHRVAMLEKSTRERDQFSYPSMIQSKTGDIWMTYSHYNLKGESIALRRISTEQIKVSPTSD